MNRNRLVAIMVMALCGAAMGDVNVSGLVNDSTDGVKGRIGFDVGEIWEVGAVGSWSLDDPEDIWGAGAYLMMDVNPGASIPISNWFGSIGEALGLPETLTGKTYVVAEVQYLDIEDDGLAAAVGPGIQIGPLVAEYLYSIVSTGDVETFRGATLSSGAVLWIGAKIEF